MKWTRFRVKTLTEAEDIIISTMYDIGLEGAQIEDKVPMSAWEKEQMFVDIPPQPQEDDGVAFLDFFVEQMEDGVLLLGEEKTDQVTVLARMEDELETLRIFADIGEGSIQVDETEDVDWINNWKQYFHQFMIDDILVIPSWEEPEQDTEGKLVLHIDPGTAFGTGMHETTQLCVRQLRKYIAPGMEVLDVGTGSGILGILALHFGAGHVMATDLDPCAVPAVEENCEANGIAPRQMELKIGNIITDEALRTQIGAKGYDVVVANILADVLVELTPVVAPLLKDSGIYITSGILEEKEEVVTAAVRASGLTVLEVTHQGEWVSVTARKG